METVLTADLSTGCLVTQLSVPSTTQKQEERGEGHEMAKKEAVTRDFVDFSRSTV